VKALITGANGFIGSHLTEFLLEEGFEIYALDIPNCSFRNLSNYKTNKKLQLIKCDLLDFNLLEKIIKDFSPNYIFHFGAQPLINASWEDPANTIRVNVIGTINVFEAIKKHNLKARVILACTSTQFGSTANIGHPLKEDDPQLAVHPYGISKVAAELLARQYYINFGIESVSVRFFNQTGPRKTVGAAADFIQRVAKIDLELAEPIIEVGNLSAYRDFTGIKDTIQAIWLAATKGKAGETYHVCSSKKTQIRKLLEIALSFSKKKIKVSENVSSKLRKTDEDIIIGDNSKIKNELGFKITQPIEDVLKEMYDYWIEYYKNFEG